MFGIGFNELIVVLVIVLLLFGGKKLPELSRSIAQGVKELCGGFTDDVHSNKAESEHKG
jgi:sec-independent protein translocase protein TatA